MVEAKEVTDKRGERKRIKGKMDCRTVGAIYGMWCKKCEKMVYVGKTQNRVMDRFIRHRADLGGRTTRNRHTTFSKKDTRAKTWEWWS